MKIQIKECQSYEGRSVQYTGEDGYPKGFILTEVMAIDNKGREWVLNQNEFWTEYDEEGFGPYPCQRISLEKGREIAAKVMEREYIESEFWYEVNQERF